MKTDTTIVNKLQKKDVWVEIPVKERLPETDGFFLTENFSSYDKKKREMWFNSEDKKWYWQPNPYSVCGDGFVVSWFEKQSGYFFTEQELKVLLGKTFDAGTNWMYDCASGEPDQQTFIYNLLK